MRLPTVRQQRHGPETAPLRQAKDGAHQEYMCVAEDRNCVGKSSVSISMPISACVAFVILLRVRADVSYPVELESRSSQTFGKSLLDTSSHHVPTRPCRLMCVCSWMRDTVPRQPEIAWVARMGTQWKIRIRSEPMKSFDQPQRSMATGFGSASELNVGSSHGCLQEDQIK